jgi:hypothetical protein
MNKQKTTRINKLGFRSLKEILAEPPAPEITSWGNWKLDKEHQVLELLIDGDWKTEIDLERCTSHKETWHCVMGLESKPWITADDIANVIAALKYLIGYKGYWRSK